MGGLSGLQGLEALQGASAAAPASTAAEAAAAPASTLPATTTTPALSGFPVPNELSALTRVQFPNTSTILSASDRLMKALQPQAAPPSGGSILSPTAPVSLPPAPPGNVPLSLQQLFSNSMARRLGNGGSGPLGGPSGNPFF